MKLARGARIRVDVHRVRVAIVVLRLRRDVGLRDPLESDEFLSAISVRETSERGWGYCWTTGAGRV